MIIVNTDRVPNREVYKVLGLVQGNIVHSKNLGRDIGAFLKTIVGGEIKDYSKMMSEAREMAVQRMTEDANKMGADAIVNVRFVSSTIMMGASEILAYGTAVKLK